MARIELAYRLLQGDPPPYTGVPVSPNEIIADVLDGGQYFTLQFSGVGIPVSQWSSNNRGPPTPFCSRPCCGGGEIIMAAVVLLSVKSRTNVQDPGLRV